MGSLVVTRSAFSGCKDVLDPRISAALHEFLCFFVVVLCADQMLPSKGILLANAFDALTQSLFPMLEFMGGSQEGNVGFAL